MSSLLSFYQKINYQFNNEELIKNALLHGSIIGIKQTFNISERYEFLGDRVLNLIIAENLMTVFPNATEGQLAKHHAYLISSKIIVQIMDDIGLRNHIHHNLEGNVIPDRVVGNIGEAFIAALYLDAGMAVTQSIVLNLWKPYINSDLTKVIDPKSTLQELAQHKYSCYPIYSLVHISGSDHQPQYTVRVTVGKSHHADGVGPSKKLAERDAAYNLLTELNPHESS